MVQQECNAFVCHLSFFLLLGQSTPDIIWRRLVFLLLSWSLANKSDRTHERSQVNANKSNKKKRSTAGDTKKKAKKKKKEEEEEKKKKKKRRPTEHKSEAKQR